MGPQAKRRVVRDHGLGQRGAACRREADLGVWPDLRRGRALIEALGELADQGRLPARLEHREVRG